jgi:hypothetical protein
MNKMPLNFCKNIFPNYSEDTFIEKRDYVQGNSIRLSCAYAPYAKKLYF